MANKKISSLTELAAAVANDLIPIVDTLTTETKKIKVGNLLNSIPISKSTVGLGNVDNTSDFNKPISSATQTALNSKENTIVAGTTSQYYRGDKTFQTLDKTAVGLNNVDNTSDLNKPISTATQTALNLKENSSNKVIKKITTTQSTTADTATSIAGANFSLSAGEIWFFEFNMQIGCSANDGIKFAITFPAGASLRCVAVGMDNSPVHQISQIISTSGVLSTVSFNNTSSQEGFLKLVGTIINSTTAGDVQLQYASGSLGQTSTIYEHSVLSAHKIV